MAILGAILAPHYGESWDERFNVNLGREELKAFYSSPDYDSVLAAGPTGPVFHMLAWVATRLLIAINPRWPAYVALHYTYFLTFLLGVYFLYRLCLRYLRPGAALAASVLFSTQPLFFGHAFINPKDIPFLSFFVMTMVLGMELVDRLPAPRQGTDPPFSSMRLRKLLNDLAQNWRESSAGRKISLGMTLVVALLFGLEIYVIHGVFLPLGLKVIMAAYQGTGPEWLSGWFVSVAENAASIPLIDYLWRFTQLYWRIRIPLLALALMPLARALLKMFGVSLRRWLSPQPELPAALGPQGPKQRLANDWRTASVARRVVAGVVLLLSSAIALDLLVFHRWLLPELLQRAWFCQARASVGGSACGFMSLVPRDDATAAGTYLWEITQRYWALRLPLAFLVLMPGSILLAGFLRQTLRDWWAVEHHRYLLAASWVLGMLISIRIVGLAAGGLISIYFLLRIRRRGLRTLTALWTMAALVAFITRPYFWSEPLQRAWRALTGIFNFEWRGSFLYQGQVVGTETVTASYSPLTVLSRQITEPMILFMVLGAGILAARMVRNSIDRSQSIILVLWILVPLTMLQLFPIQRYDNFRQFFFVLPPAIVMAGFGLMQVFQRLSGGGAKILLIGICLLPSLAGIVSLHPYEYIHYNLVSGGVRSAYGVFSLDYWCTSMRPAMEFVNWEAEPAALVAISQPEHVVWDVARSDLRLQPLTAETAIRADFLVICARQIPELGSLPSARTVYTVERQGALLSEVKVPLAP